MFKNGSDFYRTGNAPVQCLKCKSHMHFDGCCGNFYNFFCPQCGQKCGVHRNALCAYACHMYDTLGAKNSSSRR